MPNPAEFNSGLAQIESFAHEFDIEILDKNVVDIENKEDIQTHHIVMKGTNEERFYISAREDKKYFVNRFNINLINLLSMSISEQEADKILPEDENSNNNELELEDDEVDEKSWRAAGLLIAQADENALRELANYITIQTDGDGVKADFMGNEDLTFHTIQVHNYMFPFESNFGFRQFANNIQDLIIHATQVRDILNMYLTISPPEESDAEEYNLEVTLET